MLKKLFRPDRAKRHRVPDRPVSMIVGLGNPGTKYAATRHNLGFMVIDQLGSEYPTSSRERFQGALLETRHGDETLVLLKPLTFMNNSGVSVSQAARWYKVPPERILVVYDELDLPFGTIRLRAKGSAGGHNGLGSVIQHMGTNEIPRLRIGIGRPTSGSTVNYVLSRFSSAERAEVPALIDRAVAASKDWLELGVDAAMNVHNRGSVTPEPAEPEDVTKQSRE